MSDRSAMHCDAHRIYRCTVCEKVVEQARLLGLSASREAKLLARVAELEARTHEAIEVYAGMEGFVPETASEAYCLRIIDRMNKALTERWG